MLARRHFLPLFLTQFLGAFNDNVFKNALVILITFQLASCADSPVLVTVAAGLFILPFMLFSATAGQVADKFDKASMIRVVKLSEIVIMLLGACGLYLQNMTFLMVVLFAMGAQSAIFGPLKYAILPQHLHENELMSANALIQGSTFVAILFGTIVGGALIVSGQHGSLLTGIFIVVMALAGWMASLKIPSAPAATQELRIDLNPIRQTWRVAMIAVQQRDSLVAIVGISWFWYVGATFLQLFPGYTCDVLGGGPSVVILLLCTFTIGIALGSWLSAFLSGGRISLAWAPIGALGLIVFALLPSLWPPTMALEASHLQASDAWQVASNQQHWPALIGFFGLAISGGLFVVPMFAFVQQQSPAASRARVIAAANVLNALFMVLSALVTLALLKFGLDIAQIFAVTAAMTALMLSWMIIFSPRLRADCQHILFRKA